MIAKPDLAYLGPKGTFSEIVSREHYGESHHLIPKATIDEIFDYIEQDSSREGVVPIENSSGGIIHSTVDRLIGASENLTIKGQLSIRVNLALVGHKGSNEPLRVYSHLAPLYHCDHWLKVNLPDAKRMEVSSTAEAARIVSADPDSVALCPRDTAKFYSLDVLQYPVVQDVENITQFYCVGHHELSAESAKDKTSLIVTLSNTPGALVDVLSVFKNKGINLTRILSRPIAGKPQQYVFLMDISGSTDDTPVKDSIQYLKRNDLCENLAVLGGYPVFETIDS